MSYLFQNVYFKGFYTVCSTFQTTMFLNINDYLTRDAAIIGIGQ